MNFLDSSVREEISKLRNFLDSNEPRKRKRGIRKVVSLMRSGETSVSELFTSVLRCVGTNNITTKKLIYIYLVNFSKNEPEQSIMAVNAFIKDSEDPNPIIRALAVRTMCRIKIETVAEYMLIPLKKCLSDSNAYVRKTAALAVAKLYEIIPESVENTDLLNILLTLLKDDNPMVVSNSAAALIEINEHRATPFFILNQANISPLLSATTQCSEWVLIMILDSISHYQPPTAEESNFLIDRLTPLMKHSNPAVVVGAFRCIYLFMEQNKQDYSTIFNQILPPFVSLVSSEDPEIAYVVLRSISLFVKKYPKSLSKDIRYFFCKYNDPCYVKVEKLDIVVSLVSPNNTLIVVNELEEYCNDVDVLFVKKTIESLGKIAMKVQVVSRHIVDILVNQLTDSKASYAIEAAILVFKDLFRIFPGEFESVITRILSHCEGVKESESRAAVVWMLGQYSPIIENVDTLIDPYLDSFSDENPEVQVQIITSIVKIFLDRGDVVKDQLQFVLEEATKENIMPDVRNKALIYWRLLTLNRDDARDIVVRECLFKLNDPNSNIPSKFLKDELDKVSLDVIISNMGRVSGVFHVLPEDFVKEQLFKDDHDDDEQLNQQVHLNQNNTLIDVSHNIQNDLLRNWKKALIKDDDNVIDIFADWEVNKLYIKVVNKSYGFSSEPESNASSELGNFAIAINSNCIGLELDNEKGPISFPQQIGYGESFEVCLNLKTSPECVKFDNINLEVALRTSKGTKMFDVPIDLSYFATHYEQQQIEGNCLLFDKMWDELGNQNQMIGNLTDTEIADNPILSGRGLTVADREVSMNQTVLELAFCLPINLTYLAKVIQKESNINVEIRGNNLLFPLLQENLRNLFCKESSTI